MPLPGLPGAGQQLAQGAGDFGYEAALRPRVEKAWIGNLSTGESVPLIVNPGRLQEPYKANYARIVSPGLGHQRLQYSGSPNVAFTLNAYFDQILIEQNKNQGSIKNAGNFIQHTDDPDEVEAARRFLISLVTPRGGSRLRSVAPPPVMFVWPGMIEMRMRVMGVTFDHLVFRVGRPRARAYNVAIMLEEAIPTGRRLRSEDIYRPGEGGRGDGTLRPWAGVEF